MIVFINISFNFQSIYSNNSIFNTNMSILEQNIITDALYIQKIKNKLKELHNKIRYYEIHHLHHPDLQKNEI